MFASSQPVIEAPEIIGTSGVEADGPAATVPFTKIPNAVLHDRTLPLAAKVAYALLRSYAWDRGVCWPAQATLADRMGLSIGQIRRVLTLLHRRGLIDIRRGGRHNIYRILAVRQPRPAGVPMPGARPLETGDRARAIDPGAALFQRRSVDARSRRRRARRLLRPDGVDRLLRRAATGDEAASSEPDGASDHGRPSAPACDWDGADNASLCDRNRPDRASVRDRDSDRASMRAKEDHDHDGHDDGSSRHLSSYSGSSSQDPAADRASVRDRDAADRAAVRDEPPSSDLVERLAELGFVDAAEVVRQHGADRVVACLGALDRSDPPPTNPGGWLRATIVGGGEPRPIRRRPSEARRRDNSVPTEGPYGHLINPNYEEVIAWRRQLGIIPPKPSGATADSGPDRQ